MKTSQVEKLELQLVAEEKELKQHLLRVLTDAAESGSNIFTNSEFNPSILPVHLFRSDAENLLNRGPGSASGLRELVGLQSREVDRGYLPGGLSREREH